MSVEDVSRSAGVPEVLEQAKHLGFKPVYRAMFAFMG